MKDEKYLELLAEKYPTEQAVCREIINLKAILSLPKGTEHFMSDLHGEYEAFCHILNNCSGVIREKVDLLFGDTLSDLDREEICTLIYYPVEKLALIKKEGKNNEEWYRVILGKLIEIARLFSSKYTRSKVRKAMPKEYAYILDELIHVQKDEDDNQLIYHRNILDTLLELQKGIAGFYYVYDVVESVIYECKAKGIFRKEKIKPLVGDLVEYEILDAEEKTGNIIRILPRKNELIRPAVANIDQALVVFAVKKPDPHFNLLDRFLVMMERQEIPVIICFNKKDIADEPEIESLEKTYEACGYRVIFASAREGENILEIKEALKGKTTTVAGPSGVGKSSLINCLQENVNMETGSISRKIERGKHTTRHSELIPIDEDSYIMDTPGFSSLYTNDFGKEELKYYFPEFDQYQGGCRFQGCNHISEPGCLVKEALEEGKVHPVRYEDYCEMYRELEQKEKRRY